MKSYNSCNINMIDPASHEKNPDSLVLNGDSSDSNDGSNKTPLRLIDRTDWSTISNKRKKEYL